MSNPYWSKIVAKLEPYVPGEQPAQQNLVKLNTNENPFPPSPRVTDAIRAAAGDNLRLYPPPGADRLKEAIANYYMVNEKQVFVGNGSDEVLAHIFQAFFTDKKDKLLFPDISYSFYPVYCGLYGIEFSRVPLSQDFSLNLEDYSTLNGGIIFPNPNAPTGMALPLKDIDALLKKNTRSVVVIDEAYVDFGAESAASLVSQCRNLIVVQTLSKSRSLAGLRVGFALADAGLIEGLERVKNSFNSYPLDQLAIAGAVESFADEGAFQARRSTIIHNRENLCSALTERGFRVLPSAANFVFASHSDHKGIELSAALRQRGVIVRHFDKPRITDFLRITVGTEEQQACLIAALDEILGAH